MMQRCHLKNAFLAQLVGAHLKHHRKRLEHKDTADERKQQFLLDEHGDCPDRPSESERADIAHKDFGRMSVVPEKSDTRSHHRTAEDGQLGYLRHLLQSQIFRKPRVSAEVGENG